MLLGDVNVKRLQGLGICVFFSLQFWGGKADISFRKDTYVVLFNKTGFEFPCFRET